MSYVRVGERDLGPLNSGFQYSFNVRQKFLNGLVVSTTIGIWVGARQVNHLVPQKVHSFPRNRLCVLATGTDNQS